jgi:hypothetical protein
VTLTAPGKLGERTVVADSDGKFVFTGLPAGEFRLIITAPGLETYKSAVFVVKAGEVVLVSKTGLRIATSSTVNVVATQDEIAVAQVQEQEKQRVLGVFPNFYTSYIWNAEAMPVKEKYKLAFRALGDPVTLPRYVSGLRTGDRGLWKALWGGVWGHDDQSYRRERHSSLPPAPGSTVFLSGIRRGQITDVARAILHGGLSGR